MAIVIFCSGFAVLLIISFWSSKNPTPDIIWAVENPFVSALVGGAMFWTILILLNYLLKTLFK
jgi:uncharacterized membrane protein (DUF4010 family)